MSDRFALLFAAVILAAVLADFGLNGGAATLFLLRKLAEFVEYLAFWR